MRWSFRVRAEPGPAHPGCRHCGRLLAICPDCSGNYDPGRLCQHCSYGRICPGCERHWITV